jgi:hypothetical protein
MQVSRFGIVLLIVLLYVTPGVLNAWMYPAQATGDKMLSIVDQFVLR